VSLCNDLIDTLVQAPTIIVSKTKLDYYLPIWHQMRLSEFTKVIVATLHHKHRLSLHFLEQALISNEWKYMVSRLILHPNLAKPQWNLLPLVEYILSLEVEEDISYPVTRIYIHACYLRTGWATMGTELLEVVIEYKHIPS